MKRILLVLGIIALLVMAGCAQKADTPAAGAEEPTDLDADLSELEEDSLEEDLGIEDNEIEELEILYF